MKKKRIIKGIVLLLAFFVSLAGFNYYYAEKKNEGASEMTKPTLPVLSIRSGEYEINQMYGYVDEVDEALLRESITPVDGSNQIQVVLKDYDYDITAVYYQVLYGSDSTVLEEGVLNKLSEEDGIKTQTLTLENVLDEKEEYLVKFTVRLDSSRKVNYYSRLKFGTDLHFEECVKFAQDLSQMMLDKNDGVRTYLETDSDMINNNLASVNINSSFEAVVYADAKPERTSDVSVTIKEINADYMAVELRFLLEMDNAKGQTQSCDVVENYKVRYSANRMYLLDYDRTQEAYYNPEYLDTANNRIYLGSGSNDNITYRASDDNEKVCFVRQHQLWYYSYQASSVTEVFSFLGEDLTDVRASYDQHDIHILDMDKNGNIDFIVYGYMNRGRHEGENGIALYHFNAESSTNEELAFIPTKIPYQNIQEDIGKFSYLNEDGIFYFLLDGTLYQANTTDGEWEILRSNLVDNSLTASSDNSIIAVQDQEDSTKNTKITLLNLDTGKESEITCSEEERIQSAGFVLSDFVYGIAKASNVQVTKGGSLEFPMFEIRITDSSGNEVKTYQKSNRQIIKVEVSGNVIQLTYGRKSGSGYKESGSDYIRYKESEEGSNISVVFGYDTTCYNQLYLQFPSYIYVQTVPTLKLTKELVSDELQIIDVEEQGMDVTQYLVYTNGTLTGTFSTAYDAIAQAEESRGLVVNNDRQTVWESNIAEYNQVIGLNMQKVSKKSDTFASCVSMIAALEGEDVTMEEIKAAGEDKLSVLGAYTSGALNLYGCTLDQMLYYIGKEIPVIAGLGDNQYVLLMSYNSTKVRYMDPLSGEEVVVLRTAFEKQMSQSENEYYSYVRQ
ncbi:MAG: hypothetical protein Q4B70_11920 [Lachnospiraceae bacterium]|nr:hypothetical protein [Lachnospiraceae bacterium]